MRDHRKLRAFQLADELTLEVYRATREFPRKEQFGPTSQMRRAAVSVASNIVEDCTRSTQADYLRFLDMAFGSLKEAQYRISLSTRLGYLSDANAERPIELSEEASRGLAGLIAALRSGAG
jgi:four helix bundle protein